MLEPNDRVLLLKALEPPEGYRLDFAVGTTFSLDLLALLTAPLAFTMFDRAMEDEVGREDSLELLASLRRYSESIVLFCQAGRIALPRRQYPHLAWLEGSVFQCQTRGGLFHPKVWVLRYVAADSVRYRALCLSRNLTMATSWDTVLSLDGAPVGTGELTVDPNPLADFVAELPRLAKKPGLPPDLVTRISNFSDALRHVAFALPSGFKSLKFHPMGVGPHTGWPFPEGTGRALVISPFVQLAPLERVSRGRSSAIVVSTLEALAQLPQTPRGYGAFWMLDDDAVAELSATDAEAVASADEMVQLSGLHAKTYVFERGKETDVWTGSANCTDAAFRNNVEFMVRLTGQTEVAGIDTVMEEAASKGALRLRDVLQDARASVAKTEPDEAQCALELRIESLRTWISGRELIAVVSPNGEAYDVTVRGAIESPPPEVRGLTITCFPVTTVGRIRPAAFSEEVARFEQLSLDNLTAFFGFRIAAKGVKFEERFVLNIPLHGAPADRADRLLRRAIGDRAGMARFLALLLSEDGEPPDTGGPKSVPGSPSDAALPGSDSVGGGLLEMLVRTLDRAPERLDQIAGLMADLGRTKNGEDSLFPTGFEAIWQPIWEARCDIKTCETK
jgi:hypothetical protein